jgi:hypothetical protein
MPQHCDLDLIRIRRRAEAEHLGSRRMAINATVRTTTHLSVPAGIAPGHRRHPEVATRTLIPEELFGRVQGAYRTLVWGGIPIGAPAGGVLCSATNVPTVFAVGGAACVERITLTGTRMYILTVIQHASRRIRILGATAHPSAAWVTQAVRSLVMRHAPEYEHAP